MKITRVTTLSRFSLMLTRKRSLLSTLSFSSYLHAHLSLAHVMSCYKTRERPTSVQNKILARDKGERAVGAKRFVSAQRTRWTTIDADVSTASDHVNNGGEVVVVRMEKVMSE